MELRYCEACGDVIRVETDEPLSPTAQFICDRCKAAGGRATPVETAPGGAMHPSGSMNLGELAGDQKLDLFSPDTIAVRKKRFEEEVAAVDSKGSHLRFAKPGEPGSQRVHPSAPGAGPLAKSAQKLLFRCLHCRSTLSIRPVEKTSKLTCPHCGGAIYVTPAGKLHRTPPSGPPGPPASATPAPGSAPREGSVRLKPASASSRRVASASVRAPVLPAPARPGSTASRMGPTPGSQAVLPAQASPTASPMASQGAVQLSGSVRLRLAGSQAVRKAPLAEAAATGPAHTPRAPAAAPGPQGSVRLRQGSFRSSTEESRRASAFQEHSRSDDPEKTAFITDESTSDLSEITAAASARSLPGADLALPLASPDEGPDLEDSLADLLSPEEDDLADRLDPASDEGTHAMGGVHGHSVPPAAAAKRLVTRSGPVRGLATGCLRAAVVLVCLAGPVAFVEMVSAPAVANAEGPVAATCARAATVLDRVGDIGFEGLRALLRSR